MKLLLLGVLLAVGCHSPKESKEIDVWWTEGGESVPTPVPSEKAK